MSILHHYISARGLLLAVIEGVLIALALICGVYIRFWNSPEEMETIVRWPDFALRVLMVVVTLQACFYYGSLYDHTVFGRLSRQFVSLVQSLGLACLILGLAYFLFPKLLIGRGIFLISLALIGLLVLGCRIAVDKVWDRAPIQQNVLILGTKRSAQLVAEEFAKRKDDLSLRVVGFIDEGVQGRNDSRLAEPRLDLRLLGTVHDLPALAERYRAARIVVALEDRRGALPIPDLVRLRMMGVEIEDAHTALTALTGRIWLDLVQPSWFIFNSGFHRSRPTLALKRAMDVVFAAAGLVLASPLMALIAVIIRLDSRGPILFRQTRVGLEGRHFQLLKFRSMHENAEENGAQWAVENDPRLTRVGKWLRKFRLDELPQFVNILRGEMSFVGPRPERPVFVRQLRERIPYYDERHLVRPGLTGWAQVEYRYTSSVEDAARKLEYDLFYLKNMSFAFDLLILLKTMRVVLAGMNGR